MHDCIDLREFKTVWLEKISAFKQKLDSHALILKSEPDIDIR